MVYVPEGQTTDDVIAAARRKLTSQGGALSYRGRGFGPFEVNTGGGVKDVVWGPVPTRFDFRIIGAPLAVEIIWGVQVAIPECRAAKYENAVLDLSYQVGYEIDRAGLTTRHVTGAVTIAQTRAAQADKRVRFTADGWRKRVRPAPVRGFRRTRQHYALSLDQSTLTFAVTDEEMGPNTPPPGVIDVQFGQSQSNESPLNLSAYTVTFTATYDLARGVPPSVARVHFRALMTDRLNRIAAEMKLVPADGNDERPNLADVAFNAAVLAALPPIGPHAVAKFVGPFIIAHQLRRALANDPKATTFIPVSFTAAEPNAYARVTQAQFQATFQFTLPAQRFLTAGLWVPVPGSDWQAWRKSLDGTAFDDRGRAGLESRPGDLIVDLCGRPGDALDQLPAGEKRVGGVGSGGPPLGYVTPRRSWLHYRNAVTLSERNGVAVHVPLPAGHATLRTPAAVGLNTFGAAGVPGVPGGRLKTEPVIQDVSGGHFLLVMEGVAIRAGWEPADPELKEVGGAKAVRIGGSVRRELLVNCGVPVYGCAWRKVYALDGRPARLATPPHPDHSPPGPAGAGTETDLDQFIPPWER